MCVKSLKKFRPSKKIFGFFLLGIILGLIILLIAFLVIFELKYKDKVYPWVKVSNLSFAEKTPLEIKNYFEAKNADFWGLSFTFIYEDKIATISGKKLKIGYDAKLLADQAYLIGRSGNFFSALYQQLTSVNLDPAYHYDNQVLENLLADFGQKIDIPPQEALFQFSAGRVIAFKPSASGIKLDKQAAKTDLRKLISPPVSGIIKLTTVSVKPKVTTDQANNLGIKELLSEGKSFFQGSIAGRIYNVTLAANKLNGLLIAPGDIFSFNQALGEVSVATGYQQAYIIKEKRTVLDDGGGVCQVSTTLFRAALNAGLPIVERHAHAYRVGYYEQGGFGPGLDATVYSPAVDLKIQNDTPAYVLIQTIIDPQNLSLVFDLYGTNDNRLATVGKPVVFQQTSPPPDLNQDDPALPKGQIKQVDFAAWGAKVAFDYKVTRPARNASQSEAGGNGEILQNKTFYSNFAPWQAVFLKGTKE